MHETILSLAEAIVSPSDQERPLLERLCACAEVHIAGRLPQGLTAEPCTDGSTCAAALLAAAWLLSCRGAGTGEVERFTAGEVSLTLATSANGAAEALQRQAQAMMAPYWQDEAFAFREVRG